MRTASRPSRCRACRGRAAQGYAARPDVQAFIAELVATEGFDAAALRRAVRAGAGAAQGRRGDVATAARAAEVVRVFAAVPEPGARRGRRRILARQRRRARARPGGVRRSRRGDRRDHRRRNLLRPQHRLVSGDRRAVDAGLRLSAPRRVFQGRAEAVSAAYPRAGRLAARAEGILRRRDGPAAIHAGQHSRVCGGLRRRRPHRPCRRCRRRDRQRRELSRAARLAAGPAGDAGRAARSRSAGRVLRTVRWRHDRAALHRRMGA